MTFAIYEEQTGGVPLWVEVQSVATDAQGAFTVLLGATTPAGVMADVFTTANPHWVGVAVAGQEEQQRSLLASVPYALKAGDANTVGGLPVSAFVLTAAASGSATTESDSLTTLPVGGDPANDFDVPPGATTLDQVILDDLIVDGSICVGFDCVNGESFGFDTLRLKENNLRIKFQDTSTSASFPSRDWQITANDSSNGGANKFSIDDIDGARTPFTIEAGAPSHSLYVDDGGRLGLGTSTPVVDIHVKSGNTPTLRLEQDGSSGFTPQTWDLAGNEANFFIRDATNGSTLPFRIRPGAPSSAIDVAADGDIGLGTSSPTAALHVVDGGSEAVFVQGSNAGFQLQRETSLNAADGGNFLIQPGSNATTNTVMRNINNAGISLWTNNCGAHDHYRAGRRRAERWRDSCGQ